MSRILRYIYLEAPTDESFKTDEYRFERKYYEMALIDLNGYPLVLTSYGPVMAYKFPWSVAPRSISGAEAFQRHYQSKLKRGYALVVETLNCLQIDTDDEINLIRELNKRQRNVGPISFDEGEILTDVSSTLVHTESDERKTQFDPHFDALKRLIS